MQGTTLNSHHQEQLQTHHLISVWPERSGGPTKTLKRDSCALPPGNRMHVIIFGIQAAELSFVPCSLIIPDGLPLTECHKNYITKEFGLRAC